MYVERSNKKKCQEKENFKFWSLFRNENVGQMKDITETNSIGGKILTFLTKNH